MQKIQFAMFCMGLNHKLTDYRDTPAVCMYTQQRVGTCKHGTMVFEQLARERRKKKVKINYATTFQFVLLRTRALVFQVVCHLVLPSFHTCRIFMIE